MTRAPLDTLARIAARAEPPPLDDAQARRLVERAVHRARHLDDVDADLAAIRQPWSFVRTLRWSASAAIAAATVAVVVTVRDRDPADQLRVTLATGDRLVGAPGADFVVEKLAPAERAIRLRRGEVRFEVAHVAPQQQFRVVTDQLAVIAKGTFSIDADASGSHVAVTEGVVEIEQGAYRQLVAAGGEWDSRAALPVVIAASAVVKASSVSMESIASSTAVSPVAGSAASVATPAPPAPSVSAPAPKPVASTMSASSATAAAGSSASTTDPPSLGVLLPLARRAVAEGHFDEALALATKARERALPDGAWWQVTGDALRGLQRYSDAANAYDAAAEQLAGAEHAEAGYTAAYLRFHDLHDARTALASLELASTDLTPLAERGLGLRAQILVELGRRDDARAVAARYVQSYPRGDLATFMRSLTR